MPARARAAESEFLIAPLLRAHDKGESMLAPLDKCIGLTLHEGQSAAALHPRAEAAGLGAHRCRREFRSPLPVQSSVCLRRFVLATTLVGLALGTAALTTWLPPHAFAQSSPASLGPSPACPADYALVPAAAFAMGTPDGDGEDNEHPQHPVRVAAFCMQKTEVTVAAYDACVKAGGCTATDAGPWCNARKGGRADHPVNCVDWEQAVAYCRWVGGRLPTEEEWEYAARGTDGRRYPWGNDRPAAQLCWSRGDAEGTCPVGSFPAGDSPFGIHDMAGNVWEWTASAYCEYPSARCAESRRVDRGGGFSNSKPAFVRAAARFGSNPTIRAGYRGFRCVRSSR